MVFAVKPLRPKHRKIDFRKLLTRSRSTFSSHKNNCHAAGTAVMIEMGFAVFAVQNNKSFSLFFTFMMTVSCFDLSLSG
jgi:hypothetical protein